MTAKQSRRLSKTTTQEVKDATADLYVCGSSLGSEVKAKEVGARHKGRDFEHEDQKGVKGQSKKASLLGHVTTAVTSETVTSLPENLQLRIRREKTGMTGAAMLAATFPPRPRDHEVRTSPGHAGVTAELGQQQTCLDVSQVKNSLHLPRITHRTSSN